jgi:hypothetical protein
VNVFEFLAFAILMICVAGVVVIDRLFAGKRGTEHQLRLAEQRVQELLLRIGELERHADELRQQLEWNRRLLEAQDHVLQQLGAPTTSAELPSARTRA